MFIDSFVHAVLIFTSNQKLVTNVFCFFSKFIPHDLLFHSVVTTFLIVVYNRGNLTSQLICCFLFDVFNLLSLNGDSLQTSVLTSVGKFHSYCSRYIPFHLRLLIKKVTFLVYYSNSLPLQSCPMKKKKGVHGQNVFCGTTNVGEPRPRRS